VDHESNVIDSTGKIVAHYPPCAYPMVKGDQITTASSTADQPTGARVPDLAGWVEGNQQFLPAHATTWNYYSSTIDVPPDPFCTGWEDCIQDGGQTLFFFGGVSPSDNSWILQPVLQWGPSSAGGGEYWILSNWLVSNSNAYWTTPVGANAGDRVDNAMYLDHTYSCSTGTCYEWDTYMRDETNGKFTTGDFGVQNLMTVMYPAVYEAYGVMACQDTANFEALQIDANQATVWPFMTLPVTTFVNQTYNPVSCGAPYNNCVHSSPSCHYGTTTTGTTTIMW